MQTTLTEVIGIASKVPLQAG